MKYEVICCISYEVEAENSNEAELIAESLFNSSSHVYIDFFETTEINDNNNN